MSHDEATRDENRRHLITTLRAANRRDDRLAATDPRNRQGVRK